MCKFASFVLTKDQVFWSDNSDSHETIISEHNLHEAGDAGRVNILRVEISPRDSFANLFSWTYKVDQDLLPPWSDPVADEARTRTALAGRLKGQRWLAELDTFIASFKTMRWFQPDGRPLQAWHLSTAKTLDAALNAARDAACDAALDAACDAACDAASDAASDATLGAAYDAALDAARGAAYDAALDAALDVASDAASDAAFDAASDAALDAAYDAASDAAYGAALYARCIIVCRGTKLDPRHVKHAEDRWKVWTKGYACLCDINGKLFVYAKV